MSLVTSGSYPAAVTPEVKQPKPIKHPKPVEVVEVKNAD